MEETEEPDRRNSTMTQKVAQGMPAEIPTLDATKSVNQEGTDDSDQPTRERLEELVKNGANWKKINDQGDTILHIAADSGSPEGIRYFVSLGADVNARNHSDATPLLSAASATEKFVDTVKTLIDLGADVNAVDEDDDNLLLLATLNGHSKTELEQLIKMGFSWKTNGEGRNKVLFYAVRGEDPEVVKYFISLGADVTEKNKTGITPLLRTASVKHNFWELVTVLLEHGADINDEDEDGDNLLFLAALKGKSEKELDKLVELGCDWERENHEGNCILHMAAKRGNLEGVKYFLSKGVPFSGRNSLGNTPLLSAASAKQNMVEIVKVLVEHGANVEDADEDGDNLLALATINGHLKEELEELVSLGCNWRATNDNGDSILHVAAHHGNVEAIRFFIDKGVDINGQNDDDETPLLRAVKTTKNFEQVVNLLIEKGADINAVTKNGNNLLFLAVLNDKTKSTEDLEMLVNQGFVWDTTNHRDSSILHLAANGGNIPALEYFIPKGAHVHVRNRKKMTPLLMSVYSTSNFLGTVNILLKHGADMNDVDEDGDNLLFLAVLKNKSLPEIEQLVQLGFAWDGVNAEGNTILHYAAHYGSSETVKYFVEKGVPLNEKNGKGQSPLINAVFAKDNFLKTVKVLKKNGAEMNEEDEDGDNIILLAVMEEKAVGDLEQLVALGANWKATNKEGNGVLHEVAKRGHVEALKYFVGLGGDVTQKNGEGDTPLSLTCLSKHLLEMVTLLLQNGADINGVNEKGNNLLFLCVVHGRSVEDLEKLMELGAQWDIRNADGSNILHLAAEGNNEKALEYFIAKGADTNLRNDFNLTPLLHQVSAKSLEMVETLLKHGANVGDVDDRGNNLLFLATLRGKSVTFLEQLVEWGFEWNGKNKKGHSILHCAVKGENTEAMGYFISLGADINSKNDAGETPLLSAVRIENGFLEVVNVLLEAGACKDNVDCDGDNLLFLAVWEDKPFRDLEGLVALGFAWKNMTNNKGNSILHLLAKEGHVEGLKYFVNLGADVNARNNTSLTPLLSDCYNDTGNFMEVVNVLVANGADIDSVDEDGDNVIFMAVHAGRSVNDITSLLSLVPIWKIRNNKGKFILHCAAESGNVEAMTYFISKGADVNAKDVNGLTPLIYTMLAKQNFAEMVDLLVANKANVNAADRNGENVLCYAAVFGRSVEDLRKLDECGATWKVKSKKNGDTVLHLMVKSGNPEALNYFLRKRQDDNLYKTEQGKILFCPVLTDKKFVRKIQKKEKKDSEKKKPFSRKRSSLTFGRLWKGKPALPPINEDSVSKLLLYFVSKGANINAKNHNGSTPLQEAVLVKKNFQTLVDLLLKNGADINSVDKDGDNLVFNAAVEGRSKKKLEFLVERGAMWNTRNNNDHTILHYAAEGGNVEALRYFIDLGADTTEKNNDGDTPFLYALKRCTKKYRDTLKVLMEADINSVDSHGGLVIIPGNDETWPQLDQLVDLGQKWKCYEGRQGSLLHLAAHEGMAEAIKYLSFHGVDVNAKDNEGDTPLLRAIKYAATRFEETVKVLVDCGADVNAVDAEGNNAFHVATSLGWRTLPDFVQLISLECDWKGDNGKGEDVLEVLQETENFEALRYFLSY